MSIIKVKWDILLKSGQLIKVVVSYSFALIVSTTHSFNSVVVGNYYLAISADLYVALH